MLTNRAPLDQRLRLARHSQRRVGDHRRAATWLASTPDQCHDHDAMQLRNQPPPKVAVSVCRDLDRSRVDADRGRQSAGCLRTSKILRNRHELVPEPLCMQSSEPAHTSPKRFLNFPQRSSGASRN